MIESIYSWILLIINVRKSKKKESHENVGNKVRREMESIIDLQGRSRNFNPRLSW